MKYNKSRMSTRDLITHSGVARVLTINTYVLFLAFAFTATMPVFLYTPVALGGIEFSAELIAAAIGLNGVSQALWLLFVFPPLQHRVGTGGVLRLCAIAWPVFFAAMSLCHFLRRWDLPVLFWIVGPINCVIGSGVAMAFSKSTLNLNPSIIIICQLVKGRSQLTLQAACQLALNDIAPTHETLGTLNAIALAMSSGMRSVAPALATGLYAVGIKYRIAFGQFFWVLAVVAAVVLNPIVRLLPRKAEGRFDRDGVGEEEERG